jgi:hypothetical protein
LHSSQILWLSGSQFYPERILGYTLLQNIN